MSLTFKMEQLDKIVNKATLAKRALVTSAVCETELRDAMNSLKQRNAELHKDLKAKKKEAEAKQDGYLKVVVSGRHGPTKDPIFLTFNGQKTADKGVWKEGTRGWGAAKYGDDSNDTITKVNDQT